MADQDEDQDGFTNKEEYDKKTDPKDPASSPSKWVKVKITSVDPAKLLIGFSGKSEGRYTVRFKLGVKPKDVDVVVGDKIWVLAGNKAVEILKSEEEAKAKAGGTKSCPHAIPLMVKEYKDDKGKKETYRIVRNYSRKNIGNKLQISNLYYLLLSFEKVNSIKYNNY